MLDLLPVRHLSRNTLYPFMFSSVEAQENWSTLEPFLERSVRHSFGMVSVEQLQKMIFNGDAVCFGTARDGFPVAVIVVYAVPYSNFVSARIIAAAGKELEKSMEFFHIVEEWARCIGASEIEAWCRPSMARLTKKLGFKHRVAIVTRSVRRTLQ